MDSGGLQREFADPGTVEGIWEARVEGEGYSSKRNQRSPCLRAIHLAATAQISPNPKQWRGKTMKVLGYLALGDALWATENGSQGRASGVSEALSA
jgi:hypothetical protein